MYRDILTVGIALIGVMPSMIPGMRDNNAIVSANALTDYSYVNARDGNVNNVRLARCVTGLGPSGNDNGALGGLYFNNNRIPNGRCSSSIIQPRPANIDSRVGVINILQCGEFSTANEGVYTCTIRNSSMMDQSIRFGVYFTRRSESFHLYIPSLNNFHLSTQLFQ